MRIAYFLGMFPVISETFISEEIRALEARGHEVIPIALHHGERESLPEDVAALVEKTHYFLTIGKEDSEKLIKQYIFTLPRLVPFMLAQTTEPLYPFAVHCAYNANYIRKYQCTHIHAHFGWGATTYAIGAAKLLKLPVTFTCHGSDVYAHPRDLALKCKVADAIFAVAPTLTADIQKIARRTPCHTVYCGVDTNRFVPPVDRTQKHGRWLFVGRLIDCKGVDDILAAWAQLPRDVRPQLDIVGDGELRQELEAYVAEHDLRDHVQFLGAKPSSWIRENGPYYRAFVSAFRQGSDGKRDTAPMVLKEAMAMALPVVTTYFIDIPSVVGEECAVLCPVSAPSELAQAVMRIQNLSPEMLQKMGYAGRIRVEQYYSLKQQAEAMEALFYRYQRR
jgi:glycosyltransferase involved in cell wall biosynthesis